MELDAKNGRLTFMNGEKRYDMAVEPAQEYRIVAYLGGIGTEV